MSRRPTKYCKCGVELTSANKSPGRGLCSECARTYLRDAQTLRRKGLTMEMRVMTNLARLGEAAYRENILARNATLKEEYRLLEKLLKEQTDD